MLPPLTGPRHSLFTRRGLLHLHDVTVAVLLFHLLLFDLAWLAPLRARRGPPQNPSSVA